MVRSTATKRITARDEAIFRWIGGAGIASFDQLWRRYWPGRSEQTAMNRLRRLTKAGFLEMHMCDARRPGERVFTLAEGCHWQVGSAHRAALHTGLPSPSEIRQQLLAQDAYLILEAQLHEQGGKLLEWRSERQLRAKLLRARHRARQDSESLAAMSIPDAQVDILSTTGERQTLYIEIDGAYYGKMLWQKAKYLAEPGHAVIWVCTQARADYVQQAVSAYPNISILRV